MRIVTTFPERCFPISSPMHYTLLQSWLFEHRKTFEGFAFFIKLRSFTRDSAANSLKASIHRNVLLLEAVAWGIFIILEGWHLHPSMAFFFGLHRLALFFPASLLVRPQPVSAGRPAYSLITAPFERWSQSKNAQRPHFPLYLVAQVINHQWANTTAYKYLLSSSSS